ncbi:hypothetical protein DPMN_039547 [Dreissena polymorpha]|uniref:Uncharacterized protein n=1 Tax=Dreissena polymorpha TaxID=45954 RepID=A0A9D4CV60_DREPO|nr:hypothetical protein DPMN_039547 [Dreissena polymorpha]
MAASRSWTPVALCGYRGWRRRTGTCTRVGRRAPPAGWRHRRSSRSPRRRRRHSTNGGWTRSKWRREPTFKLTARRTDSRRQISGGLKMGSHCVTAGSTTPRGFS